MKDLLLNKLELSAFAILENDDEGKENAARRREKNPVKFLVKSHVFCLHQVKLQVEN